jgi:hypothetical protein
MDPQSSVRVTSPCHGKTIEDCVKWLKAAPNNFLLIKQKSLPRSSAINKFSVEDDTVLLRCVRMRGEGLEVYYFPIAAEQIEVKRGRTRKIECRGK